MTRVYCLVVGLLLLFPSLGRGEDSAKTVLILLTRAALLNDRVVLDTLETTLRERWPSRVHFYAEDVGPDRFSAEAYRRELPDYLRAKYSGRVDLLVVLSATALEFVLPNRSALFPGVPIVFAGRAQSTEELAQAGITGIVVRSEPARTVGLALQLHEYVNQVVVVGGTGPADRVSSERATRDLSALGNRVTVTPLIDLSLSVLLDRLRSLPAGTIILYTRMSSDASGAALDPRDVLRLMREASHVPIYGNSQSYVGAGIVGGVVVDHEAIGRELGLFASQILAGERSPGIPAVPAHNVIAFDERELRRFKVDERRLPSGAVIEFRSRTLRQVLEAHAVPFTVLGASLLVLIGAFLTERRARLNTQSALQERHEFGQAFSDLSTTFISMPSERIDVAIRGALIRLLESVGADEAIIYDAPDPSESPWKARFQESRQGLDLDVARDDWDAQRAPWLISKLRAGQVIAFLDTKTHDQLMACAPGPAAPSAAVVVPLSVGQQVIGALWCIWLRPPGTRFAHDILVERLRLVGQLFANALQRSRIGATLEDTRDLNSAILESLVLHVAVLDRHGTIIAVNDAWLSFGRRNGISRESAITPGANYLEVARIGAEQGAPLAREAFEGIGAVCEGRRELFTMEYECPSPHAQRWYVMTVAALRRHGGGAVVTHRDITESKQIEVAIRESEARFRLLADALPVGVWMSDTEARRIYFNRMWLDFTGRRIEWHLGDGWTYILHPEDRQRYLDRYASACAAREPFSMEYRVQRHDQRYGWFFDTAVPRYGIDGSFHGYVGGCLDISERKEAEDALRDLTSRVITAEEEDRKRIARELHDGVSQLVALLAIEIQQLGQTSLESQEELTARTTALWERTAEISRDLQRQAHALHPSRLETFGLVPALEGYCASLTEQNLVRVLFSQQDVPHATPPETALCVFRIVQEALRNVVRHSGAREAAVELARSNGQLRVSVRDSGRGFDPSSRYGGLGLVSIRERVRLVGGHLAISSRPGEGTRIDVQLPLRTTEPSATSG